MKETITIYLNGTLKKVEKRDYTYQEVVEVSGKNQGQFYTIVSTEEDGKNPKTYSRGDKIRMNEGMRINIDITING